MARTSPAPFAPSGIDHVVFRVADGEHLVAFYCGVLGCPSSGSIRRCESISRATAFRSSYNPK